MSGYTVSDKVLARRIKSRKTDPEKVIEFYLADHSLRATGLKFGITMQRVHQILGDYGIPRRSRQWRTP